MIAKNQNPRTVRLVISMLNRSNRVGNNLSKEADILVIGFLARTFGRNLIDSIDKPPNFFKTINRVLDLTLSYFKYPHNIIIAQIIWQSVEHVLSAGTTSTSTVYQKRNKIVSTRY